jgi:hypothetical protein
MLKPEECNVFLELLKEHEECPNWIVHELQIEGDKETPKRELNYVANEDKLIEDYIKYNLSFFAKDKQGYNVIMQLANFTEKTTHIYDFTGNNDNWKNFRDTYLNNVLYYEIDDDYCPLFWMLSHNCIQAPINIAIPDLGAYKKISLPGWDTYLYKDGEFWARNEKTKKVFCNQDRDKTLQTSPWRLYITIHEVTPRPHPVDAYLKLLIKDFQNAIHSNKCILVDKVKVLESFEYLFLCEHGNQKYLVELDAFGNLYKSEDFSVFKNLFDNFSDPDPDKEQVVFNLIHKKWKEVEGCNTNYPELFTNLSYDNYNEAQAGSAGLFVKYEQTTEKYGKNVANSLWKTQAKICLTYETKIYASLIGEISEINSKLLPGLKTLCGDFGALYKENQQNDLTTGILAVKGQTEELNKSLDKYISDYENADKTLDDLCKLLIKAGEVQVEFEAKENSYKNYKQRSDDLKNSI